MFYKVGFLAPPFERQTIVCNISFPPNRTLIPCDMKNHGERLQVNCDVKNLPIHQSLQIHGAIELVASPVKLVNLLSALAEKQTLYLSSSGVSATLEKYTSAKEEILLDARLARLSVAVKASATASAMEMSSSTLAYIYTKHLHGLHSQIALSSSTVSATLTHALHPLPQGMTLGSKDHVRTILVQHAKPEPSAIGLSADVRLKKYAQAKLSPARMDMQQSNANLSYVLMVQSLEPAGFSMQAGDATATVSLPIRIHAEFTMQSNSPNTVRRYSAKPEPAGLELHANVKLREEWAGVKLEEACIGLAAGEINTQMKRLRKLAEMDNFDLASFDDMPFEQVDFVDIDLDD